MGIDVRKAVTADIPAIHSIRNYYIVHSDATVNSRLRTQEETGEWFRLAAERYPFHVAEEGGRVVGYGALGPFRGADGYARTAEVTVYVHHEQWGKGIGSALLAGLCQAAPDYGLRCLVAAITAGNDGSVALHLKHGFAVKGVLERLAEKDGKILDVVFMTKILEG